MDLQYFPHFIRKNYPEIADITNEEINEIGLQFKEYLKEIYKGEQDKLDKVWDISPMKVVMNAEHPLHYPACYMVGDEPTKLADKWGEENKSISKFNQHVKKIIKNMRRAI